MTDFMVGFAFVVSVVALALSWYTARKVRAVFRIIADRKTRTVTIDMRDGNITVVREYKDEPKTN